MFTFLCFMFWDSLKSIIDVITYTTTIILCIIVYACLKKVLTILGINFNVMSLIRFEA